MMIECRQCVRSREDYHSIRNRLVEIFDGWLELWIARIELRNAEQAEDGVAARPRVRDSEQNDRGEAGI